MRRKILIIEDNKELAELVGMHLRDLAFDVKLVFDGKTGLKEADSSKYDLVILDLMLPGVDGIEICKTLRKRSSYIPILMLTSKSSEIDRVLGLELGADDYVTKPFSMRELMARVKAIFRRVNRLHENRNGNETSGIKTGDLYINPEKRMVLSRGKPVDLTAKEFDLLMHFARNPGKVFTRAQLLNHVWGYGHEGYEHTVNSHINRLRAKIEKNASNPRYVLTVWGVGYKFAEPGDFSGD
jgi:DNA-binding response OmpR family regulator